MKLYFGIFVILVLGLFIFLNSKQENTQVTSPIATDSTSGQMQQKLVSASPSVLEKMEELNFEGKLFKFIAQKIENKSKLHLYSNLDQKDTSSNLFSKNNCNLLVNGGYYDADNKPLGWFVSEGNEVKKRIESRLMDGVIFQTNDNKISIDLNSPSEPVIWGLQSGPMLILDHQLVNLKIQNDELTRRIVAAKTEKGDVFFLVIVGENYLTSGPYLADLPLVIEKIGKKLNEKWQAAINLDGGTASAYISRDFEIKEFSNIGSFFCLKDN